MSQLPFNQAEDVVIRSIKRTSGQDAVPTDSLQDVGFPDPGSLNGLRNTIVHSAVGVQQDGFKISSADLAGISSQSTVDDVAQIVMNKAVSQGT
ncbi:MAG: hypothetical protein ACREDR_29930 [Blastocatellia bacterium]